MLDKYFAQYPQTGGATKAQIRHLLRKVGNESDFINEAINSGMSPIQFAVYLKSQAEGMGDIMVAPDPKPVREQKPAPEPETPAESSIPEPRRARRKFSLPKFSMPKINFGNPFARFGKKADDPGDPPGSAKPEHGESVFTRIISNKWVKVGGGVIAALVILMVIIAVVGVPSGQGGGMPVPTTEPFTPPALPHTLLPVDLANASWFSPTQVIIALIFLMLGFANYRDAKQRGQASDFYATIIGFVLVISAGFVASLLKGPLGWLQLNDFQLLYFTSALMAAISFVLVWEVSRQGGVDYSPLGDYVTSIAGWALLVGSLGAIGVVLNTPKAPVLPFSQVSTLFVLKQYSQIWMSLTVYALLILGAFIYGSEILRMSRTLNAKEMTGTILTSFVGLLAYPAIRIFAGWDPIQTFLAAIALASLTGLVAVRAGAVSPLTTGETRTSNAVTLPWDKIAFQLTVGLLLITLLGKV